MNKLQFPLLIYILFCLSGVCLSVSITTLTVPSVVKANTENITLICEYSVEDWEKNDVFVLKWYIDSVHLVYQWIPEQKPQVLGRLRGHVDTTSFHSSDPWVDRGYLHIRKPTVELSGRYSCKVSTFESEDTKMANMLVWSPPSNLIVEYWRPSEYVVNFTCVAIDVYPEPQVRLYMIDPDGHRRRIKIRVQNHLHRKSTVPSPGNKKSSGLLAYRNLRTGSTLSCQIHTPGTMYKEISQVIYRDDIPIVSTTEPPRFLPEEEAVRSANVAASSSEIQPCPKGAQLIWTALLIVLCGRLIASHRIL